MDADEIKIFKLSKFLQFKNYENNKSYIYMLSNEIIKSVIGDNCELITYNSSKKNNSSETGPGGMYQIYNYMESFSVGSYHYGYRVFISEKLHEAYDIAWRGSFETKSFGLPDNQSFEFILKDRCELEIETKLTNEINNLIVKFIENLI